MQPDTIFSASSTFALLGWILLLAGFRKAWAVRAARWGALALAVVYTGIIAFHFRGAEGGFGSLEEVKTLFNNECLLLAGWIHYLAFDLFTGAWIVAEGQRDSLPWWRVLPALPLTFLFGPAGLLLFAILRGRMI